MKSTAADHDKSSNGRRLDELAELLAVAISRANTRRMAAQSRESSTGLGAGIQPVLGQDNHP